MRTLVLILMVFTFLIGAGISGALSAKLSKDKEEYESLVVLANESINTAEQMHESLKEMGGEVTTEMRESLAELKADAEALPSGGALSTSIFLGFIAVLVSLIVVIFAFLKKELTIKLSFVLIGVGVLFWILTPSIEPIGFSRAANPKSLALAGAIGLIVTALLAFFSYKLYAKKQIGVDVE